MSDPKRLSSLSVSLTSPVVQTCSLSIENYTSDTVSVKYVGLSGNQPKDYGNFVAIWEASTIPWNIQPIERRMIPQNGQIGTLAISGLTITQSNYVLGYAVGNKMTEICASAQISLGGLKAPPKEVSISIAYIGTNSLSVNYSTLSGYLPKTYKNWVGLWKGYASPYNAPEPIGKSYVQDDSSQGTLAINNIVLGIDSTYTLVYFMDEDQSKNWPRTLTNAAAILNFQTAKPPQKSTVGE